MADGERIMSAFQRAASLPQEAPHILNVIEAKPGDTDDAACVIDIDEFEDALRDPKVQAFQERARQYGATLLSEGRTE